MSMSADDFKLKKSSCQMVSAVGDKCYKSWNCEEHTGAKQSSSVSYQKISALYSGQKTGALPAYDAGVALTNQAEDCCCRSDANCGAGLTCETSQTAFKTNMWMCKAPKSLCITIKKIEFESIG